MQLKRCACRDTGVKYEYTNELIVSSDEILNSHLVARLAQLGYGSLKPKNSVLNIPHTF